MNQKQRDRDYREQKEQRERSRRAETIGGTVFVVLILLVMIATGQDNLFIVLGYVALIFIPVVVVAWIITTIVKAIAPKDDQDGNDG